MNSDKLTEFVTVLVFALTFGSAGMLAVLYLNGVWLQGSIIAIVVATILSWKYLRKRFKRG